MSTPVERMKVLMNALPEKDISLGYKFLNSRDFDSLKELVDSAIYKVKRNLFRSMNPKEEYLKINLEDLNRLKSEVDTYVVQLELSEYNSDNDEFNGGYY